MDGTDGVARTSDPRTDPVAGVDAVWEATERLVATAHRLDPAALAGPSLCPGWTRAHVLGHVARNADGLAHLCAWARTGRPAPMYETADSRSADIERSARQARADLLEDVAASAERFATAFADLPDAAWSRTMHLGPGGSGAAIPGARIGWQRLKEVEIHHVDLAFGYSPADWPAGFVARALGQTLRMFGRRDDAPAVVVDVPGDEPVRLGEGEGPTVRGTPAALLAWLTGRSAGDDLSVEPAGRLPTPPAWA